LEKIQQLPPIIPLTEIKPDDFKIFDFKTSGFLNVSEKDLKTKKEEEEKRKKKCHLWNLTHI